ncbi:DUF4365 domain-containing protein [Microseira sp. BLCC-F43]|uniref:DUF4365 domain-containing protein n=1 Tax=Microseira sp. BLCC-F43 TaxID=3153602 RepID=UPI0035BB1804
MDINQQKEQFSNTYIQAVASVAGYSLYRPDVDDDSVDLGIAARGGMGPILSPRLELQLKCTSRDILDSACVRYPLNLKNYNDLRINTLVPPILVVVLVPDNLNEWLQQSEQKLCMRYCGYWISLRGQPETRNTTAVTVELPRSNQFTVEALRGIIDRISLGGVP